MAVWLLALAWQAQTGPEGVSLPRRLVWVVNRRVVVDQASSEAAKLKERLKKEGPTELDAVRGALRKLAAANTDDLLAVSTLRGQFADNAEWRDDPARPAVIVGTVDMVGSRLLFAGYGRGFKSRPLHAGFIGQDTLLVHDEAHLEPAFQHLIVAVESEQQRCGDPRPLRVMALTATSRGTDDKQFTLTNADRKHGEIQKRIYAKKGLAFHLVDDEKAVATEAYQRALEFKDSGQAVVVFLLRVKDVEDVASKLKTVRPVQMLTGTLRGYERDELARTDDVFARFTPDPSVLPRDGTVYLVCTSAGEVGINISADHLICDLTPFDSMAQRLGRVNRFGKGEARVEVVYAKTADDQTSKKKAGQLKFVQACERTQTLLKGLPRGTDGRYDGSPAALGDLPIDSRLAAFTPPPTILATSDILFDAWALTSIRGKLPGRPPVADWLHGITEWEPPQTYVAWRQEVEVISPALQEVYSSEDLEDLLEDYPLKPHELLRDTASRVLDHLKKIANKHSEVPVWLVDPEGGVEVLKLAEVASKRDFEIADCTVLLPPPVGGLDERGMLNGDIEYGDARRESYDIADRWFDDKGRPRRCRAWDAGKPPRMRLVRTIDTRSPDADDELNEEEQASARRYWRWYVRPRSADDDGSWTAPREQDWEEHTNEAERVARELVARLSLKEPEASAIVLAAGWHDLGKRRELWQRLIGNRDYPKRVLAKSGHNVMFGRSGYRHEFGSLTDVSHCEKFLELTLDAQDLILHLVAAHHGRARPHFPLDEAFDPKSTDAIATESRVRRPAASGDSNASTAGGAWRTSNLWCGPQMPWHRKTSNR
jgi:CRISPR-associated endonuclease/helicase Cas3